MSVICSVLATATPLVDTHLRKAVEAALPVKTPAKILWEGHAAEWALPDTVDAPGLCAALRSQFAALPIDINVFAPAGLRRKKLLLCDMDATIVAGETLDELAVYAGLGEKVAAITARAMNGDISFHDALRERVGLLGGLPAETIEKVLAGMHYIPGAKALIATMKAHGVKTALVSGGFRNFTKVVREQLGFDHDFGNVLHVADGKLTGTVEEPIQDRFTKQKVLHELCGIYDFSQLDTAAVGDGANDVLMLETAGLGVAFQPKPALARQVSIHIIHSDLRALLFLQGYHYSDIKHI